MPEQALVSVEFNLQEVESHSLDLLEFLGHKNLSIGQAIAATGYALGLLMAQRTPSQNESAAFCKDLVEWVGMYWTGGEN